MLDVFVRKALAPRTLCQSDITASHGRGRLRFGPHRYLTLLCGAGGGWFGRLIDGRRILGACVAAVKNMVESGDWIAAFNTDGHTTLTKTSSH